MSNLHNTINSLASQFAHDLLRALRGASLDEIVAETSAGHARRPGRPRAQVAGGGGGEVHAPLFRGKHAKRSKRLARRSAADLAKMVDKLVAIVKGAKSGINAEGLKAALGIDRRELPRPLGMALESKRISKRGHKRATTYFAGAGGAGSGKATPKGSPAAKKRRVKRVAKKIPTKRVAKRTAAKRAPKKAKRAPKPKPAAKPPVVAPTPAAPPASG